MPCSVNFSRWKSQRQGALREYFGEPFFFFLTDEEDSYRVGSANFSRQKIGHAHDNFADSENVAGAREPNVRAQFFFRFENRQGNQSFLSIHDQKTAETSQPQAQPADD